jgi:hypothetical protein
VKGSASQCTNKQTSIKITQKRSHGALEGITSETTVCWLGLYVASGVQAASFVFVNIFIFMLVKGNF